MSTPQPPPPSALPLWLRSCCHPQRRRRRRSKLSCKTQQLVLVLYHRDKLSVGADRQRLGPSAYHWALALTTSTPGPCDSYSSDPASPEPPAVGHIYDVTDASPAPDSSIPSPATAAPSPHPWRYRHRPSQPLSPAADPRIVALIILCRAPQGATSEAVDRSLSGLRLPREGQGVQGAAAEEGEDCVGWVKRALRVLGGEGWAVCEGEGEEADGGEKGLAEGRGGGGWMAEMQGFVLGEADERIRLGVRKDVWSEFVPRGRDGG